MNSLAADITLPQLDELIDVIKKIHRFDFTHYTKASLKRRMQRVMHLKKMDYLGLKYNLINDLAFFQEFIDAITVNVTEMFRDPSFYKSLNNDVLPHLSTYQAIKIWSAGCSSGEEAYSLAILMQQAGLKDRSLIYATDINSEMLDQAKKGIYSLRNINNYSANYKKAAMPGALTDHFSIVKDAATINSELIEQTLFSVHNLISDKVYNEFQMICCRNVFIYFDATLQNEIIEVFYNSLCNLGFLCLGSKETIRSAYYKSRLKVINSKENIYQKIG